MPEPLLGLGQRDVLAGGVRVTQTTVEAEELAEDLECDVIELIFLLLSHVRDRLNHQLFLARALLGPIFHTEEEEVLPQL